MTEKNPLKNIDSLLKIYKENNIAKVIESVNKDLESNKENYNFSNMLNQNEDWKELIINFLQLIKVYKEFKKTKTTKPQPEQPKNQSDETKDRGLEPAIPQPKQRKRRAETDKFNDISVKKAQSKPTFPESQTERNKFDQIESPKIQSDEKKDRGLGPTKPQTKQNKPRIADFLSSGQNRPSSVPQSRTNMLETMTTIPDTMDYLLRKHIPNLTKCMRSWKEKVLKLNHDLDRIEFDLNKLKE